MVKKVHIIINPAAGQPQPILNQINDVFHPTGVEWSVSITLKSGDAARFTREAIRQGAEVVGAYGGDGTIMEVAQAIQGGEVPMAILPGGTANLMSLELGIPKDLGKATQIMVDPQGQIRRIDMGQISAPVGEKHFMLRVGMGFAGEKVRLADRELKDRWGILAYSIAGLKALSSIEQAHYRITVDGIEYETDGKTCLIDNAGNLGMRGVTASKEISVSDGLPDVIVVRDSSFSSLVAVGSGILDREVNPDAVKHYQGHKITIECDPQQTVQGDGEIWGQTPVSVQVLPGVLPILTPLDCE